MGLACDLSKGRSVLGAAWCYGCFSGLDLCDLLLDFFSRYPAI